MAIETPLVLEFQVSGSDWEELVSDSSRHNLTGWIELDSGFIIDLDLVFEWFANGITFMALDAENVGEQYGNIKIRVREDRR